ncbi:four helix bundle protein [Marinifilum sp. D714]|uniref:four helix bundle protein n=1 Tax=Marinifilum sp. D714 TaxID=2937523 RepID=UPI0027BC373E|nr:four helix bundle protein [Marinifilum sp. D714]MDQ2179831.1 four helix bundle protein [Marinifilum sp. D714]
MFKFSVDVIKGVRNLPNGTEFQVVSHQILKSATSVGANYEEAQAAVSNADFSNKIAISLKEIRETNYWIRLILTISSKKDVWDDLEKESMELMKILGTIHSKTRKRFNK